MSPLRRAGGGPIPLAYGRGSAGAIVGVKIFLPKTEFVFGLSRLVTEQGGKFCLDRGEAKRTLEDGIQELIKGYRIIRSSAYGNV